MSEIYSIVFKLFIMAIFLNIDDYLTLDYLEEKLDSDNNITVENNGNNFNSNVIGIKKKIFEPTETGEYTIEYNGKSINVNVYDVFDFEDGVANNWNFNNNSGTSELRSDSKLNGSYYIYAQGDNNTTPATANHIEDLNISIPFELKARVKQTNRIDAGGVKINAATKYDSNGQISEGYEFAMFSRDNNIDARLYTSSNLSYDRNSTSVGQSTEYTVSLKVTSISIKATHNKTSTVSSISNNYDVDPKYIGFEAQECAAIADDFRINNL